MGPGGAEMREDADKQSGLGIRLLETLLFPPGSCLLSRAIPQTLLRELSSGPLQGRLQATECLPWRRHMSRLGERGSSF